MLQKVIFVSVSPPLTLMAYVPMGLLLLPTKTPQQTSSSMCLARIPPILLSSGHHPTYSLRKPSSTRRRMPLTWGLVNGNNATVLSLGVTIFGSFCPNLRSLFNRFTQTIYDNEKDSFCRSLSSIRKYYTNLWSVTCLSISATALTKARNISSKSYNAYDAQCNYMQDAIYTPSNSTLSLSPNIVSLVSLLDSWFIS
jgi:hypothetical protein